MNEHYLDLIAEGGVSLERLATLCRVADAGGLSKAARGDVSRLSLYSRQLKDLEGFFGVALTRKVGRTVVLTDEARQVAALARGYFRELSVFREGVGRSRPTLTLGSSQSVFEWWLWPRLGALKKSLPEGARLKTVVMRSADLVRAVEDQVLDAALMRADAVTRTLRSKPAFVMAYSLFVPAGMKPGKTVDAATFAHLPLALSAGGQIRERLLSGAAKAGVELNIAMECPSFTLVAKAVQSGEYAAILPDLAEKAVDGPLVRKFPVPLDGLPPRPIVLAWHPRTPESRLKPVVGVVRRERKE